MGPFSRQPLPSVNCRVSWAAGTRGVSTDRGSLPFFPWDVSLFPPHVRRSVEPAP